MDSRRVVITGLGAVSSIGIGAPAFFDALAAGTVGIRRIQAFDPSGFPCQIAGEVLNFATRDYVPKSYRKQTKVMSRDIELAIGAADTAIRDSGLVTKGVDETKETADSTRFAVHIGAGLICADLTELGQAVQHAVEDGKFSLARWGREGMNYLTPLWLLKYLPNMLSAHVTIIHDTQGPSNTITCADASSHLSIGESLRIIQRGAADIGLAGGAESKLNPMGLLRQCMLKRMTFSHNDDPASAVRPFDRARDGTAIGEGGGLVVLEELGHATKRNAKIYAEAAGFGASFSVSNLTDPEPDGRALAESISAALADAKMTADEIDLVVPHGTGIASHDLAEARGLHAALGRRAGEVPVWPILAQVGNTGAGSGGLAVVAAATAMSRGVVPAAVNCPKPDPACGLSIVTAPRTGNFRAALMTSYALGGQNAAVVIKKMV
ncbi:MAG: beta-ketoacyl-[acyl-carrier-protein] synthase family protein [Phycisphaerae bacterium]|nr:beta-ketoacyl-[acyl-carrier-protein] synthase family protein [Phycisphaerae bacterium]